MAGMARFGGEGWIEGVEGVDGRVDGAAVGLIFDVGAPAAGLYSPKKRSASGSGGAGLEAAFFRLAGLMYAWAASSSTACLLSF